jgi:hypothetical protein
MMVTADHAAAVRALVTGDDDAFGQMIDDADPGWSDAFARLFASMFLCAVKFRFTGEGPQPDVIRFVAQSRIRHGGDQAGYSPSVAESLMGSALGINPVPTGLDDAESGTAQLALLKDLAGELSFLDFEALLGAAQGELNKNNLEPPRGPGAR